MEIVGEMSFHEFSPITALIKVLLSIYLVYHEVSSDFNLVSKMKFRVSVIFHLLFLSSTIVSVKFC